MTFLKIVQRIILVALCLVVIVEIGRLINLSTDKDEVKIESIKVAPDGSPLFIETLSEIAKAPIGHGGAVELINDGDKFLSALINTINSATYSIDFTTYPWSKGVFSDKVFEALKEATKRGVEVRILFDAVGSHTISDETIKNLKNAGIKVAVYHKFNPLNPFQFDERNHMRLIIIDGKVGFTGGMGIGDDWFGNSPSETWQDLMFKIKDSMAESLQESFAKIWNITTGEIISGPKFFPLASKTHSVTNPQNTFVSVMSIPFDGSRPIRDSLVLTALSAQKTLYIVCPFILPDQKVLNVLENRARAGVDVRIVSPGEKTPGPLLRFMWRSDYQQLLDAGVKVYEYQPSMIHAKFVVADDKWSLIGSANIDNRSEAINTEDVMGIEDLKLANSLQNIFLGYISKSKEITSTDWKNQYGVFSKLFSKMFLILANEY